MSGLTDTNDRLGAEWSALRRQWEETRREWRDEVGDRFERDFWSDWEEVMPQLLKSMNELDEVLDTALRRTAR